jgi:hypothetical protein
MLCRVYLPNAFGLLKHLITLFVFCTSSFIFYFSKSNLDLHISEGMTFSKHVLGQTCSFFSSFFLWIIKILVYKSILQSIKFNLLKTITGTQNIDIIHILLFILPLSDFRGLRLWSLGFYADFNNWGLIKVVR